MGLTRSTTSSSETYNYIVNDTHMQTLPTVPPLWYDQKRVNSLEHVRQISYNLSLLQSLFCVLRVCRSYSVTFVNRTPIFDDCRVVR